MTQNQQQPSHATALGEQAWARTTERVSGELFAMTYGGLVNHLVQDQEALNPHLTINERMNTVNQQLEGIGIRIGQRIIDEYLAKSGAVSTVGGGLNPCRNFAATGEAIAKIAFKMFLNISNAQVVFPGNNAQGSRGGSLPTTTYSIVFEDNPLMGFAELPEHLRTSTLRYSSVLCGVIQGALEQVQLKVKVTFPKDVMRGDSINEIKVVKI